MTTPPIQYSFEFLRQQSKQMRVILYQNDRWPDPFNFEKKFLKTKKEQERLKHWPETKDGDTVFEITGFDADQHKIILNWCKQQTWFQSRKSNTCRCTGVGINYVRLYNWQAFIKFDKDHKTEAALFKLRWLTP